MNTRVYADAGLRTPVLHAPSFIKKKQIQFLSGQNSRIKRVEIWGSITPEQIAQALSP